MIDKTFVSNQNWLKTPLSKAINHMAFTHRHHIKHTLSSNCMRSYCWAVLSLSLGSAFSMTAMAEVAENRSDEHSSLINHSNEPTSTLDPIVITATKTSRSVNDAPVNVQVIDKKQLDNHHAHTLKQALALLPNVTLRQIHGKTGYEVMMQGLSGNQVLVLIDGLPIIASTDSKFNLNQYLNMDIEQIEVVQGAASAQYGSSAMGGVINIITKPIKNKKAHLTTELATNGNQNPSGKPLDANYRFVEGSMEGNLDKDNEWRARVSASYLDDKGLSLDNEKWARLKDSSKQKQINAKIVYQLQPNAQQSIQQNYWLEANHYQEDDIQRSTLYVVPHFLPQQKDEAIKKNRISAGLQTKFNLDNLADTEQTDADNAPLTSKKELTLNASALYENYQSDSNTARSGQLIIQRATEIDTRLLQAQIDLPMWQPSESHRHFVQVGGQWQQDKLSQHNNQHSELSADKVNRQAKEVYVQDDWFIGENWEVLTGVRYQHDTDFGQHLAPKVSVKYQQLSDNGFDHIWRASVGSGYRVPNLKERYYIFDHSANGYKVLGNADLKPETSTSYQVGYQGQLNDAMVLSVNGFYNDVKDLIQTDRDKPTSYEGNIAIYEYVNVDSAKTYGGDVSLNWQISDRTKLKNTYIYTHSKNERTNTPLTNVPKHKVNLDVEHQLNDKLQLIGKLNYESKQLIGTNNLAYSPSWWRVDTLANYQLNPNLKVYAGINNLFNQQRDTNQPADFTPIENRQWLIGASYQWK